jgi:hypothetical protein
VVAEAEAVGTAVGSAVSPPGTPVVEVLLASGSTGIPSVPPPATSPEEEDPGTAISASISARSSSVM